MEMTVTSKSAYAHYHIHFVHYVEQSTNGCTTTAMGTLFSVCVADDDDDAWDDAGGDDTSTMSRPTFGAFWFPC